MNTPESTLFNAVPVVSELNRVAGFDPLRFLKKTANGHELELRYKKLWFRLKYPAGRTRLTPLRITDQLAIIEAKVFFDKDDADPASSYIATMTQENAPAGLYIQAAEHDALDMALTNAGFGVQFAPMPKADTPYAEPITPVMRSEPAPAPQAAAEQVRTEPAAVRADIEPVVVQQPEQEVVHHAEKAVPDTAPVEVSAEQPAEAVVEPVVETELPFVYDEPSAASYTKDMDVDTICTLMTEAEAEEIIVPIGTCSGQTLKQVAERRPASLKWYVKGYSGDDNILRAGAKLMLDKLQRLANAADRRIVRDDGKEVARWRSHRSSRSISWMWLSCCICISGADRRTAYMPTARSAVISGGR